MKDEDGVKKAKHTKVNRMSVAEAQAAMANCEKVGDTGSNYYLRVKKVSGGK